MRKSVSVTGVRLAVLALAVLSGSASGHGVSAGAKAAACDRTSRIAYSAEHLDGRWEIHTVAADGSGHRRLTTNNYDDVTPAWSPDGRRLAWATDRDGDTDLWVMRADGSRRRQLTDARNTDVSPAWSPDGAWLAFASSRADRLRDGEHFDIYVIRADGSEVRRLTKATANEGRPTWSGDGRWVLFTRDNAVQEIYKVRRDGTRVRRVTSGLWAHNADWSSTAKRLAVQVEDFNRGTAIFTLREDGTGKRRLTPWDTFQSPSWGPGGRRLAFTDDWQLSVMRADGTRRRVVRRQAAAHYYVDWGPRVRCG